MLVLVAFKRFPNIRQPTTCLICGLSIADVLGSFSTPSLLLLRWSRGTNFWIYAAHLRLVVNVLFIIGNVTFSALIALERLLTLSFPLTYMTFITTEHAYLCVVATWVYLVLGVTLVSVSSHSFLQRQPHTMLNEYIVLAPNLPHAFMVTHFYLLLIVTVISYLLIARIAVGILLVDQQQRHFGSQWKITKLVVTVGMVFFICYLPSALINQLLRHEVYEPRQLIMCYMIANCIYHVSAIINPFLYAAKTNYFRNAFRKLLPNFLVGNTFLNNSVGVSSW